VSRAEDQVNAEKRKLFEEQMQIIKQPGRARRSLIVARRLNNPQSER
jgi:hypothetical protein